MQKDIINETVNAMRKLDKSLETERTTFRLTPRASELLDLIVDIEQKGVGEVRLLDEYAKFVVSDSKSDRYRHHFEFWIKRNSPEMGGAVRHTRRLSSSMIKILEDLAVRFSMTRDQILEGFVEYWALWRLIDASRAVKELRELLDHAEPIETVLAELAEEAAAAGRESLAAGQLGSDMDLWRDSLDLNQRFLDVAGELTDRLTEFFQTYSRIFSHSQEN